ncbi:MAG: PelD GGDEF domain-containing protein [Gammaproteobacteria bacterium]
MNQTPDLHGQLPEPAPTWLKITESAVITAAVPLLGYWLSPLDPFFVEADFPWLMLAPLLVGLRYGINAGAFSVFTLVGVMAIGFVHGYLPWDEFPLLHSVGMLVTVLLVGEFGSVWNKRNNLLRAMNEYRDDRLREFGHAYNLLKQSHDGLEQRLAANSTSLRGCMISVRRELARAQATLGPLYDFGPTILRLFTHYGSLQKASLFVVDGSGQLEGEAVARVGNPEPVAPGLRLIREAISSGEITYIDTETADNADAPEPLMAVIPIRDLDERIWAVICVEALPFRAYTAENLRQMAVMADYVGDMLNAKLSVPDAHDLDQQAFMLQLERCVEDANRHHLSARLLGLRFVSTQTAFQLAGMIMEFVRGLELHWMVHDRDGQVVLLILMPFTDEISLRDFLRRLQTQIKERYGFANLELAGVESHETPIDRGDIAMDALLRVAEPCNVDLAENLTGAGDQEDDFL